MAFLSPAFLAAAIPGALSGLGAILQIASESKKLARGGRLRRKRVYKPRGKGMIVARLPAHRRVVAGPRRPYGKGIVADIAGSIPLLGMFAGPLVKAMGGKAMVVSKKRYVKKRRVMGGRIGYKRLHPAKLRIKKRKGVGFAALNNHYAQLSAYGQGLYPPGGVRQRVLLGNGLLAPAGGLVSYRKGYYRTTPSGYRVHVKPTVVRTGRGGYLPYTVRY